MTDSWSVDYLMRALYNARSETPHPVSNDEWAHVKQTLPPATLGSLRRGAEEELARQKNLA